MIKIEKFENVYGIKKLINCNLIKNNTIIYAPNSVMKTSFADGIDKIQNGEIPVDLFSDEKTKASFTIENNGVKIEENSKKIKLDALIFKQSDFMSVLDNPNIGSLVMSIKLKKQYKDVLDNYESIKQSFNELISKKVLLRRNVDENDIQKVGELYGKTLFTDIIDAIPDLSEYNDAYYKKIEYSELFNDKTESVISTDKFVEKCINYKNYVNKEIDNRVFNSGFDLDSLIEIQKILVSKNYFKAGHKIHLASCEEMDEGALDAYIKKIINDVYGSEEGKRLFTEAKKMLNKNAATRKLASIVESDKRIIEEMSDPKKFKEKILLTKLSDYSDEIDKYKNNVSEYKKQIQSLLKEAEKTKGIWGKIINDYNSRFVSNKFDVKIENIRDVVLDVNPPKFKKIIRGTDKEITEEIFERFSSGEKRAITILNLLFEVELRKNDEFTLILDDIADSFDYKNKYAIIECLNDFATEENIQLIILTHNFDFYRSVRITLGNSLTSKLLAYLSDDGVTLFDAREEYFENFSYYSNWRNNGKIEDAIAIIPFLRNIIQLQHNILDDNYKLLTQFLHYSDETDKKLMSELSDLFENNDIKHGFDDSKYLEKLEKIAQSLINTNVKETDLRSKIILGIYIRVFTDKFMWNKYFKINKRQPDINRNNRNQSRYLYNKVKDNLSDSEKKTLLTAFVIAPSFIHVNSFMFEPLIDVGAEKLKETARSIKMLFED